MKWMPIETAPKDGTTVLLWGLWCGEINGPDDKPTGPYVGKFSDGRSDYGSEGWWDLDGGDAYMTWCKPTHWMPLPEPPAQGKADDQAK